MILDEFFKSKSTTVLTENNLQGASPDDEVKFFIDSEPAYYAVMDRFGDHIEFRGDDMIAPQRLWSAIQQTAGDAGGAADIAGLEDDRMGTDDELDEQGVAEATLSELSPATLARYKTKAGAAATAADSTGDRRSGDRRFSGIVKATKKQFDQDAKQSAQAVHEGRLRLMASIIKTQ